MASFTDNAAAHGEPAGEIDLRALAAALKRRRRAYLLPTLLVFVLVAIYVNVIAPRYTATSQVLLENQETFFTRPERTNLAPDQAALLDDAAIASQAQLANSPDIARKAIDDLGLKGNPEFDPQARMGALKRVLVLLGLAHDPTDDSAEERMVQAFLEKLVVYSPPKTRIITIQFTSRSAALSARAANTVAELYLQAQSSAKRAIAKEAADALAAQIADLKIKLAKADADRESYRLQSGLLSGSNNMTLSGQQLADINGDLSKARSVQADAQAKASMIRQLLRSGKAADVADVTNNDIVRRIWDQRAVAQAQLALESRTLLPGHPRVKELTAQVEQYDIALKSAAKQAANTLENEAKIAGDRVANLEAVLAQQTKVAGVANTDEIRLRALDRTAQGLKDQLESSTTKYQEAMARQSSAATPADARIISRATRPDDASFPRKLPFIVFGTVAAFVLSTGFVIAGELLSGRAAPRAIEPVRIEDETAKPQPHWTPEPETAVPPPRQHQEPRRTPKADLLDKLLPREEEPDPVFAPLPEHVEPVKPDPKVFAIGGLVGATIEYLKRFGRSAAASRVQLGSAAKTFKRDHEGFRWANETDETPAPRDAGAAEVQTRPTGDGLEIVQKRIVAAHVPGRGLHVVGTGIGQDDDGRATVELARLLARKGRTIIVDLHRTPHKLAPLADPERGRMKVAGMLGLSDLLAGDSSFAEVIYRDHGSKLHFVPAGVQDADFRDFDLVLDALSETYDFIVMLTPAFPNSEIAKVMAPYADFVVLAAAKDADPETLAVLKVELKEAGAREVLTTATQPSEHVGAQDVA